MSTGPPTPLENLFVISPGILSHRFALSIYHPVDSTQSWTVGLELRLFQCGRIVCHTGWIVCDRIRRLMPTVSGTLRSQRLSLRVSPLHMLSCRETSTAIKRFPALFF